MAESNGSGSNVGRVEQVTGVVIDAVFPDELPEIFSAVTIETSGGDNDGESAVLVCEVQQHLGDDRVRAVAMDATDGIERGAAVTDTGGPITVPVGDATLGRIFNLLGEPIDNGEETEAEQAQSASEWEYEPEPEKLLARLIPEYVNISVYRALLESAASELGARMTAMRNAAENADEMIGDLTLEMNRARQAEITQEILEVVGGAEALG